MPCSVSLDDIGGAGCRKVYSCSYCDQIFVELSDLVVHKRGQHEKQVFGDAWRVEMERNKEKEGTLTPFPQDVNFREHQSPLTEDIPSHEGLNADKTTDKNCSFGANGEKTNTCRYCKKKAYGMSFRAHQVRCMRQRKKPDDCDCPYCGNWYLTPELLAAHIGSTHGSPELVRDTMRECGKCDKVFLNLKYLKNHTVLAHNVESDESDLETYDENTAMEVNGSEEVVQTICVQDKQGGGNEKSYNDETSNENQTLDVDGDMTGVQATHVTDRQTDVRKRKRKTKRLESSSSNLDSNGEGFTGENVECRECGNGFSTVDQLYDHYNDAHRNAMQDLIRRVQLAHCEPKVGITDFDDSGSDTDTDSSIFVESMKAERKRLNKQPKLKTSPAKMRKTSQKDNRGDRVRCKLCFKSYPTVRGLKMHMNFSHHRNSGRSDNTNQSTVTSQDSVRSDQKPVQSGSIEHNAEAHQESVQSGSNIIQSSVIHRESVDSGWTNGSSIIVSQESVQSESVNTTVTGSLNEKTFLCKSCGEPFFTSGGLRHHSQTHLHDSGRDYHCQMCKEAFFYKSGLDTHMQHAHSARNSGNSSDECLGNDTMITSTAKNDGCRIPKDVATSNPTLSEPIRKSHRRKGLKPEPRFWCEKCNRPYVLEFYFNVHRKKCLVEPKIISGRNTLKSESSGDSKSTDKSTSGNGSNETQTQPLWVSSSTSKIPIDSGRPIPSEKTKTLSESSSSISSDSDESKDSQESSDETTESSDEPTSSLKSTSSSSSDEDDCRSNPLGFGKNDVSSVPASRNSASTKQCQEFLSFQQIDERKQPGAITCTSKSDATEASYSTNKTGASRSESSKSNIKDDRTSEGNAKSSSLVSNMMGDAPGKCTVAENNLKQKESRKTADISLHNKKESETFPDHLKEPNKEDSEMFPGYPKEYVKYCEDCDESGGSETWLGIHARIRHGRVLTSLNPGIKSIVEKSVSTVLKPGELYESRHYDKPEEISAGHEKDSYNKEQRDNEGNTPEEHAQCNKTDGQDELTEGGRKKMEESYNETQESNLNQKNIDKEIWHNQTEHEKEKASKLRNVERNEGDQQTETSKNTNLLHPTNEVIHKGSDTFRQKENLDHKDDEAKAKQFTVDQDLLLSPGYTVELASDSFNDSSESQKPKKRIDEGITAELGNRCVGPNMQYGCALCDKSFPSGHVAFFLHAVEEHNGLVRGNIIKSLNNRKDAEEKMKIPKKKKRRKMFKESEENIRSSTEFSSSDESHQVEPGSEHEGELPTKTTEMEVGSKDEEENIGEKCHQGDNENMETSKKCEQCHRDFQTEKQLINHKAGTEQSAGCAGAKVEEFRCEGCGKVFNSIGTMQRHFASCPRTRICYLCDMLCMTRDEYKKHFETEHSDFLTGKKKSPMAKLTFPTCDICDKSFLAKENLKLHQKNAHKEPIRKGQGETSLLQPDTAVSKITKVQFSSFIDTIYIEDDDYDDFQPEPVQRMPKSVFASAKSKEEAASKEALRTQQVITNMLGNCQPMLGSLQTVVRQPFEELLVKKIRDVPRKDNEERLEVLIATGDFDQNKLIPDLNPTSYQNRIVNGNGDEIPVLVGADSGPVEKVQNINDATDAQGTNVNITCGGNESKRLDCDKSSREYRDNVKVSIPQTCTGAEEISDQNRNTIVADDNLTHSASKNPTHSAYNRETVSKHHSSRDISSDEYNRTILKYAKRNKLEMEQPIEDREYTIIGDNLLQVKNGYILGTTTDRILMHLHTSRKNSAKVEERIAKKCDSKNRDKDEEIEKNIPSEIVRVTGEEQQTEGVDLRKVTAEHTDEVQSSEEMLTDVFNNIVDAILDGFVDETPDISHPDPIQNKTPDVDANDAGQIKETTPYIDANGADEIQETTPDMVVNDAVQSIRLDGTTGTWTKICEASRFF